MHKKQEKELKRKKIKTEKSKSKVRPSTFIVGSELQDAKLKETNKMDDYTLYDLDVLKLKLEAGLIHPDVQTDLAKYLYSTVNQQNLASTREIKTVLDKIFNLTIKYVLHTYTRGGYYLSRVVTFEEGWKEMAVKKNKFIKTQKQYAGR